MNVGALKQGMHCVNVEVNISDEAANVQIHWIVICLINCLQYTLVIRSDSLICPIHYATVSTLPSSQVFKVSVFVRVLY